MRFMAADRPLLDAALTQVSPHCRLWIALSGGMDSVCLLHLAAEAVHYRIRHQLPVPSLHAVHVNHHLQDAASHFEAECHALCDRLTIPLRVVHVTPEAMGSGIEAAARNARYQAFRECLAADDVLWLAHHRNDQAETFLLRLLRGGGLTGLKGMPSCRRLGAGWLQRPLLDVPHGTLQALALEQHWQWVDDPTNEDTEFDRNWVRHQVIPTLEVRWPQALRTLAYTADHLRESNQLLNHYAQEELARLVPDPSCLPVAALLEREPPHIALLIRCALEQLQLPLPPRSRLQALIEQLSMREDRCGEVMWDGALARLWKGHLYLLSDSTLIGSSSDDDWYCYAYSLLKTRLLPSQDTFVVLPRQGGERLFYQGMHRRVKTLLQQFDIPPWERSRLVFVYADMAAGSTEGIAEETVESRDSSNRYRKGTVQRKKIPVHVLVAVMSPTLCLVADDWQPAFRYTGKDTEFSTQFH